MCNLKKAMSEKVNKEIKSSMDKISYFRCTNKRGCHFEDQDILENRMDEIDIKTQFIVKSIMKHVFES